MKDKDNMKTQSTFESIVNLSRQALATSSALAMLLLPEVAVAEESNLPPTVAVADPHFHAALVSGGAGSELHERGRIPAERDKSGWGLTFTPVLLMPHDDYRFGGGV